jgi:hypothetical protein
VRLGEHAHHHKVDNEQQPIDASKELVLFVFGKGVILGIASEEPI